MCTFKNTFMNNFYIKLKCILYVFILTNFLQNSTACADLTKRFLQSTKLLLNYTLIELVCLFYSLLFFFSLLLTTDQYYTNWSQYTYINGATWLVLSDAAIAQSSQTRYPWASRTIQQCTIYPLLIDVINITVLLKIRPRSLCVLLELLDDSERCILFFFVWRSQTIYRGGICATRSEPKH